MATDLDLAQAIYLALIQGFTEFLPISSSGHLVLVPALLKHEVQSISFDIAVHFGSLIAVIWFFRHQLVAMTADWFRSVAHRKTVGESPLAWAVLWGTVPAGIFGMVLHFVYDEKFNSAIAWIAIVSVITGLCLLYFIIRRNTTVVKYLLFASVVMAALIAVAFLYYKQLRGPTVIAITTLLFGVLLYVADRLGKRQRDLQGITWKDVLVIGMAQAIAIIPGTSRSGITITLALLIGFKRAAAARFSFLLSIPTILLAAGALVYKFSKSSEQVDWMIIGVGAAVSAISAYLCIYLFLKLIDRIGMLPFVLYRIVLAGVLFYLVYTGFF